MALARVQAISSSATVATTIAATFASPPTIGNGIIVIACSSTTTTGCADNQGNTYTLAADANSVGRAAIWYSGAITATGTPFTITVSGSSGSRILAIIEVSGGGVQGLVVDQIKTATGSSTTPTTGATPTLVGSEVFVAGGLHSSSTTQTSITVDASSPTWTEERERLTTATGEIDSRIVSSASGTTQSISWTLSVSAAWWAALAAFRVSDASPRVSQDAIEVLSQPVPDARIGQYTIEVLSATTPVPGQITQYVVELLSQSVTVSTETTQFFIIS